VFPARVGFVADTAQFTPREVETRSERDKLMFRVKLRIAPELLRQYAERVKPGLPGDAYVLLAPDAEWPENLAVRLPPADR
jgi:HlyD family secretion protein